jgi:hypothetical protein
MRLLKPSTNGRHCSYLTDPEDPRRRFIRFHLHQISVALKNRLFPGTLPEVLSRDEVSKAAEPVPGEAGAFFTEIALEHQAVVVAGFAEKDGDRLDNACYGSIDRLRFRRPCAVQRRPGG